MGYTYIYLIPDVHIYVHVYLGRESLGRRRKGGSEIGMDVSQGTQSLKSIRG